MKEKITGGCECGAVRYEIHLAPLEMFNCHCKTCQKVTGGAYTPVVLVSSKAFKLTRGTLKHHYSDGKGTDGKGTARDNSITFVHRKAAPHKIPLEFKNRMGLLDLSSYRGASRRCADGLNAPPL